MNISYTADLAKMYIDGLRKCKTQEQLTKLITEWKELAYDALECVTSDSFSWPEFEKGWKLESRAEYAGDEWADKYGGIVLPAVMLIISMTAMHFVVPEGAAFHRLKDVKVIYLNGKGGFVIDQSKMPNYEN